MKTPQVRYTPEEKARMDEIIGAFSTYINEHFYFDILYSNKCGYIYIVIAEEDIPCDFLEDSSDLLYRLFMDVSSDVRSLQLQGPHTTVDLYPEEITETRRRLLEYFEPLSEETKDFCIEEMNEFLAERE